MRECVRGMRERKKREGCTEGRREKKGRKREGHRESEIQLKKERVCVCEKGR